MATCVIPALDGTPARTLTATRSEESLTLELTGLHTGPWSVRLPGIDGVRSVEGGTVQSDADGAIILPDKDARSLIVHF